MSGEEFVRSTQGIDWDLVTDYGRACREGNEDLVAKERKKLLSHIADLRKETADKASAVETFKSVILDLEGKLRGMASAAREEERLRPRPPTCACRPDVASERRQSDLVLRANAERLITLLDEAARIHAYVDRFYESVRREAKETIRLSEEGR